MSKEGNDICKLIDIPLITKNAISNSETDRAVHDFCEKNLIKEMEGSSKMKDTLDEKFERKEYLSNKKVTEARTMFAFRSHMYPCKTNYMNEPKFKYELWQCDSCQSAIDSQSHVMICPSYSPLRELSLIHI